MALFLSISVFKRNGAFSLERLASLGNLFLFFIIMFHLSLHILLLVALTGEGDG
jgi:hypothetical protein